MRGLHPIVYAFQIIHRNERSWTKSGKGYRGFSIGWTYLQNTLLFNGCSLYAHMFLSLTKSQTYLNSTNREQERNESKGGKIFGRHSWKFLLRVPLPSAGILFCWSWPKSKWICSHCLSEFAVIFWIPTSKRSWTQSNNQNLKIYVWGSHGHTRRRACM